MMCPICKHIKSDVIDSRPKMDSKITRRRRCCQSCGHRWTTFEGIIDTHHYYTSITQMNRVLAIFVSKLDDINKVIKITEDYPID
jgi:transcriptional regulator NrdR family protein